MDECVKTIYIRLKKPRWFDYPDQAYDYAYELVYAIESLGITHKLKLPDKRPYYSYTEGRWIRE